MPIRDKDKVRGKIGQTRVPEWSDDENEEIQGDIRPTREAALENAFPPHEKEEEEEDTTTIVRKDDRSLRRLAESRIDNREEVRADHLPIRRADIVSTIEEEARRREGLELEEEDENALAERIRQIKEKREALAQKEKEEEEEEELAVVRPVFVPIPKRREGLAMTKPRFIPNRKRYTIAEREPLEAEERALKEAKKRRLGSKDKESQENMELEANVADVDTDDELNEAEEYEAWKVREIRRIKLDRGVREAMLKVRNNTKEVMREWDREVREAMLKVRNMTEEVMSEWEIFLQKWMYMHEGV